MADAPPITSIQTAKGLIHGKNLKAWRVANGWSLEKLAELSGLSKGVLGNMERSSPNSYPHNVKKILDFFRQHTAANPPTLAVDGKPQLPSSEQMSVLGAALQGKWLGWHWTRRRNGAVFLAKTLWTVDPDGQCVLNHVHTKVTFRGTFDFEADSRLIFTFQSEAAIPEHLVFRFDQPDAPDAEHLYGGWFGIDYGDRLRSDHALLTRRPKMSEAEATQKLAELPEFMARPIARSADPIQPVRQPSPTGSVSAAAELDDFHLLSPPSPKQLVTLRDDLAFEWLEWHWTRKEGQPTVVKVAWKIEPDGRCVIRHVESGLTYRGSVRFEGDSRLVFVLVNSDARIEELAVYRFPSSPGARQLAGFWFGIDYHHQTLGDRSLLTRDLTMSSEQARQILDGMGAMTANPVERVAQSVRVETSWDKKAFRKAVLDAADSDSITAISTYFPFETELTYWLSEAARRRTAEGKLQIRILLLDPQAKQMIAAREEHRAEPRGQIGRLIREQVARFSKLSKDPELAETAVIQLKLFFAWPFGMAIQLGKDSIYWGLIMASESAVNGPMFVLGSAETGLWKLLAGDIEKVWGEARDPTPEDFPEVDGRA